VTVTTKHFFHAIYGRSGDARVLIVEALAHDRAGLDVQAWTWKWPARTIRFMSLDHTALPVRRCVQASSSAWLWRGSAPGEVFKFRGSGAVLPRRSPAEPSRGMVVATREASEVHPTAIVAAGANWPDASSSGPMRSIGEHARVGARTRSCAVVIEAYPHRRGLHGAKLRQTGRHAHTTYLGEPGPSSSSATANRILGKHVTMHIGTVKAAASPVGDDGMFLATSHVGHDCSVGENGSWRNPRPWGHVHIGDFVMVSGLARSTILQESGVTPSSAPGGGDQGRDARRPGLRAITPTSRVSTSWAQARDFDARRSASCARPPPVFAAEGHVPERIDDNASTFGPAAPVSGDNRVNRPTPDDRSDLPGTRGGGRNA